MPRPKVILLMVGLALLIFLVTVGTLYPRQAISASMSPKRAAFEITNTFAVKVPDQAQIVRIWFAVPQADNESDIRDFVVVTPHDVSFGVDSQGNRVGYLEVRQPQEKEIVVRETFKLTRSEIRNAAPPAASRPLTKQEQDELKPYLQPSTYVIMTDETRTLAAQIVGDEKNPVVAARKIYDWVLQNIDYWVKDPDHLRASPVGSTAYCLSTKTGNCTDFHSLYASLSRSAGIPTQIIYGSLLKPTLNGLDVDASYHCWVQIFAPNIGWVTLDVAVADIYVGDFDTSDKNSKLVELTTATGYHGKDNLMIDYYFGNLDERRVVWSVGRDLRMNPPQDGAPVNALPKMYVEVDGKEYKEWTRKFTYKEVPQS